MKEEWEDWDKLSSGLLISYEALLESDIKTTLTAMPFFDEFSFESCFFDYYLSATNVIESTIVSLAFDFLNFSILICCS